MLLDGELGRGKQPQLLQAQKGKLRMKGVRKLTCSAQKGQGV